MQHFFLCLNKRKKINIHRILHHMSKKSWPFSYSDSSYYKGHDFLDIQQVLMDGVNVN